MKSYIVRHANQYDKQARVYNSEKQSNDTRLLQPQPKPFLLNVV